jgi:glyoxylase I family protein
MQGQNNVLGGGGFHHVAIRVKDFDASVKFYTEVLGFKESIAWGEGDKRAIMLDTGDGSSLELFAGETDDNKPEGNYLHIALRTTRCDAVIQTIKALGMEVTMEPKDVDLASNPPTPVRIAFFKGLDGELIELFQTR